ncbi:DUF5712 family protein [Belliella sp. DSM 111904]|uniref:DUF5712 family protein n=1 Tax=Belliella filtrata TaxID=2923435 RepID=A0ABS9V0K8_9BACT|nr:DUF5712 family protein [Belliella filtrata]MCH7409932.1 DUF5712 family protein [Belliella filtrata]
MYIDFGDKKDQSNRGSCAEKVQYLEKENEGKSDSEKRCFFSQTMDHIEPIRVEAHIDSNHKKFKKTEAKFYMLIICPSQKELMHINCSEEKLKKYTRAYMDSYAKNFGRGLTGDDLVYYAKIEEDRVDKKTKQKKPGLNFHVHILVSRMDREKRYSLSPWTNHINTETGPIKGGFHRNVSRQQSQEIFDNLFGYQRGFEETFEYQNQVKKELNNDRIQRESQPKEQINPIPNVKLEQQLFFNILFPIPSTEWIYEFDDQEQILKKKKKINRGMSM